MAPLVAYHRLAKSTLPTHNPTSSISSTFYPLEKSEPNLTPFTLTKMATFAPPARRGDFIYSSVLYADPGNGNHHGRASVAELAALLRPEAPDIYSKGRKPDVATPAKDQVWHFYSAQLIHYGLPVTKDKNVAKVRLLNAMNQFKLEVPAWILKVESELKAEWEAENKKLKKGGNVASKKAPKSTAPHDSGYGSSQGVTGGVNVTGRPAEPSNLPLLTLHHSQSGLGVWRNIAQSIYGCAAGQQQHREEATASQTQTRYQ
jgi:hypothetical protein